MTIVEPEESSETEKEEGKKIDMEVWQNFKRTVEKRPDGYYVHLPWKHSSDLLPDNWSISFKRLHKVWNDLREEGNLLDQYYEIFVKQIGENILEDIGHEPTKQCRKMSITPSEEKIEAIDVKTLGVWKTQSRRSYIGEANEIYKTLEKFQLRSVKMIVLQTLRFIVILVRRTNKRRKCAIQLSRLLRRIHIENNDNIKGENNKIAEKILVKQHQIAKLTPTIIHLLKALNIKQHPDGLFRYYGRLRNSELEENAKNPLIVLQKSWFADNIIKDCHNKGHSGVGHTMSLVREKY
ncbi:hypothetical protein DICVIV_13324 [Dictyocaulus viviparus]|uniref:Integrase zinc-binding domain-containing protein n=1 Tax=Dictyocaulus viviparus TaxID=29172 RepID=A0A0D8X835_DICVI|nr:hypothetical protein DICVIV_13324 [Dictyocaulus viviparus]